MRLKGQRKCVHCQRFYFPDPRTRYHQRHCAQGACRQASKAGSQSRWLARPENRDYFSDAVQRDRVRDWRAAHPKYWKKRGPAGPVALQDVCGVQPPDIEVNVAWDGRGALKEEWKMQAPLVIGLISHLTGVLGSEEIVEMTGRLIAKGHALIGAQPRTTPVPDDDRKTHIGARPAAAGARSVQLGRPRPGAPGLPEKSRGEGVGVVLGAGRRGGRARQSRRTA